MHILTCILVNVNKDKDNKDTESKGVSKSKDVDSILFFTQFD